jgi:hypothetical protein
LLSVFAVSERPQPRTADHDEIIVREIRRRARARVQLLDQRLDVGYDNPLLKLCYGTITDSNAYSHADHHTYANRNIHSYSYAATYHVTEVLTRRAGKAATSLVSLAIFLCGFNDLINFTTRKSFLFQ